LGERKRRIPRDYTRGSTGHKTQEGVRYGARSTKTGSGVPIRWVWLLQRPKGSWYDSITRASTLSGLQS
jgi:hypothetical protein